MIHGIGQTLKRPWRFTSPASSSPQSGKSAGPILGIQARRRPLADARCRIEARLLLEGPPIDQKRRALATVCSLCGNRARREYGRSTKILLKFNSELSDRIKHRQRNGTPSGGMASRRDRCPHNGQKLNARYSVTFRQKFLSASTSPSHWQSTSTT